MAQEELRQALPVRRQPVAGVGEGPGQVAGGLALRVGDVHLDDLAQGELLGEELGVAPVGLAPPVAGGPHHLGDGADGAVHAQGPELPAEVESGDAGLVDGPGRLEGEDPRRDGGRVVGERPELHLPGAGVERAALDAACVDVQTDRSRIIRHESPSRACGNRAGRLPGRHGHYRPRPTRSPGRARRAVGALYVLLISSV